MQRLKEWTKQKLRELLDMETYERGISSKFTNLYIDMASLHEDIRETRKEAILLDSAIRSLKTTVESVVHIGTDVHYNERQCSWAVICIEGKVNIVKFVELNRMDAMAIMRFLKQFEAGRHCIDAPHKDMFYDGLFRID